MGAQIVSAITTNEFQNFPHWNLQEKSVLELIANDFWSLAAVFGHAFCELGTAFDNLEKIMLNIAETIISTEEINEMVQTNLKSMFDELEKNSEILTKCPKSLQMMLKSILQSNPITRMKNVEDILQVYGSVMNIQKTMAFGNVLKLEQKILQTRIKAKYNK